MAAIFLVLLDDPDTSTPFFMERHRGEAALAFYVGLFYLYAGVAAAVCAVQWGGAVRQVPFRSLRNGLRMMSVAMVTAVIYAVLRTAFLLAITFFDISQGASHTQERMTDTLLYLCFLLWGLGAIAPATHAARERYHALRSLLDLYPLWRPLALHSPDTVRYRPSTASGVPGCRPTAGGRHEVVARYLTVDRWVNQQLCRSDLGRRRKACKT